MMKQVAAFFRSKAWCRKSEKEETFLSANSRQRSDLLDFTEPRRAMLHIPQRAASTHYQIAQVSVSRAQSSASTRSQRAQVSVSRAQSPASTRSQRAQVPISRAQRAEAKPRPIAGSTGRERK